MKNKMSLVETQRDKTLSNRMRLMRMREYGLHLRSGGHAEFLIGV